MAKNINWNPGDLVNIRLRDDLFTIGQMLTSPIMQFFDICNPNGDWKNINLNETSPLFHVFVSRAINKNLATGKISEKTVIPRTTKIDYLWIKPYTLAMDGNHYKGDKNSFPFLGGKLIDLGPAGNVGVTLAPVIQEDLNLPEDRQIIEDIELTNMWGDEDLSDRLQRFFDTGINRDDLKFEVFPGLWDDRESLRPLTRRLPITLR